MKLVEKILVPTDFHGSSDRSLEMAIELAKKFDSEIILLHILSNNPSLNEYESLIKKEVNRQFSALHSRLTENGIKKISQVIRAGKKYDVIVKFAESEDVNMILMGSGESRSKDQSRLGTTTKRVIELSTKPVWVTLEDSTQDIKSIVCPIDFSGPSRRALTNAIHLARYFKAKLVVLTVSESVAYLLDGLDMEMDSVEDISQNTIEKQLQDYLEKFDFNEVQWESQVRHGKPHIEILKAIEEQGDETLLTIGTTGRSGLSKLLMGSVTEKVTRELPCSFITLKEEDIIVLQLNSELDDLSAHFKEGIELLKNGFPKEAINQFNLCLNINDLYTAAWDAMALSYDRLKDEKKAENCRKRAKDIRTRIDEQKIIAEIRSRHWMVGK